MKLKLNEDDKILIIYSICFLVLGLTVGIGMWVSIGYKFAMGIIDCIYTGFQMSILGCIGTCILFLMILLFCMFWILGPIWFTVYTFVAIYRDHKRKKKNL